jgi:hypothetical protein
LAPDRQGNRNSLAGSGRGHFGLCTPQVDYHRFQESGAGRRIQNSGT